MQESTEILEAAYNDRNGVTATFNLNLLVRANRELGADFDIAQWHHHAIYNREIGRIEMHLLSARQQTAHVGGEEFHFFPGEKIITQFSYKYTQQGFIDLAATAGFRFSHVWTYPLKLFDVFHFVVAD